MLYTESPFIFTNFQNSKKYKGKNLWNFLQNLPRVEIGGAALWLLLLVTTCWSCTAVLQILKASTLSKFSTMNILFWWRYTFLVHVLIMLMILCAFLTCTFIKKKSNTNFYVFVNRVVVLIFAHLKSLRY